MPVNMNVQVNMTVSWSLSVFTAAYCIQNKSQVRVLTNKALVVFSCILICGYHANKDFAVKNEFT